MEDYKPECKNICSQLLQWNAAEEDDFLCSTVTYGKSCFHHFELERKWQSMEWHHRMSPGKNRPNTVHPSAFKIMDTIFSAEGCILIDFLLPGETVKVTCYIQTLQELHHALCDKCLGKWIILHQDSIHSHNAYGGNSEQLGNSPSSSLKNSILRGPDLSPRDNHFFGFVKNHTQGQH